MKAASGSRVRVALVVAGCLAMIWGILSVLDVPNLTYSGLRTGRTGRVTQVVGGSPAQAAGFAAGDVIISVDGTPWNDARARALRSRPAVEETRSFEVQRAGRSMALRLTYSRLTGATSLAAYGAILLGAALLVFGLWAYITVPTRATALLAALGFSLGPALMGGPYFTAPALRTFVGSVFLVAFTVGFAVLAHFLLVFPKPKAFLDRRAIPWIIYGPAAIVSLLGLWAAIARPAATSLAAVAINTAGGLFLFACLGTAVIAVIHTYVKASPAERAMNGLNLLVLGTAAGLGPSILIGIVVAVAPQAVPSGAPVYLLSELIIPACFALAAVKAGRTSVQGV